MSLIFTELDLFFKARKTVKKSKLLCLMSWETVDSFQSNMHEHIIKTAELIFKVNLLFFFIRKFGRLHVPVPFSLGKPSARFYLECSWTNCQIPADLALIGGNKKQT